MINPPQYHSVSHPWPHNVSMACERGGRVLASLPIYYSSAMDAPADDFSPSAAKPALVVESWRRLGFPLRFSVPEPVSRAQLFLAHAQGFVVGVLEGRLRNGFGNKRLEIARSLPYTSGAMLGAAREAMSNGAVAVAPCSGFHHAGWKVVGGFCTFNGLMVTALVLKRAGAIKRAGILDLDQHWGDGTQDIIQRTGSEDWVVHYSPTQQRWGCENADEFVAALPEILQRFEGCDLVLFQAGADPHVDDPLGGWLTTEQLRMRDGTVFRTLQSKGIPVAWNLAGGYQRDASGGIRPVLDIHDNTLRECAAVYLEGR